MRVENVLSFLDVVLGLNKISTLSFLLLSAIFTFTATILILYWAVFSTKNQELESSINNSRVQSRVKIKVHHLYPLSSVLMFLGLIHSLVVLTVSNLLVLGLSLYIITLAITTMVNTTPMRGVVNVFSVVSAMLFGFFFSSKVLLNGIDASETATDVLQIYYEGFFRFSRHAGWYDLAPIDAILKNFLLRILGVGDPYDPLTTTLMFASLSISLITAVIALLRRLYKGDLMKEKALAIILLSSCPYTALISLSTPPVNFTLVFSILAIMLITRDSSGSGALNKFAVFTILTTAAILSHPMSLVIPIYILALMVASTSTFLRIPLSKFLVLSVVLYLLKSIYTATIYGISTMLNIILKSFHHIFIQLVEREVPEILFFHEGPRPPKASLLSFGAFPGMLAAILFIEILAYFKKRNSDIHSISVIILSLALILGGIITNFLYPSSRYLAVPGITLASFQLIIYFCKLRKKFNNRWLKLLFALFSVLAISTILSPNAMTEHYNVFTGGRWPRIENFILSRIIMNNLDTNYIVEVYYQLRKPSLHTYLSRDILLYGHPYQYIGTLIVEKLLIPEIIDAKSYWDFYGGRLFIKWSGYINNPSFLDNIVFSGWRWTCTWI